MSLKSGGQRASQKCALKMKQLKLGKQEVTAPSFLECSGTPSQPAASQRVSTRHVLSVLSLRAKTSAAHPPEHHSTVWNQQDQQNQ